MNDSEKIILEKIKNLRNQKGLSQSKLAQEIGISQTGYAKIERGDTDNIPLSVAVGIANALNVGFNSLFDIDGDSKKIDSLNNKIKELTATIEDKDLLLKSISQSNRHLKSYLISQIYHSNLERIRLTEEKIKSCTDENDLEFLKHQLNSYRKNPNNVYKYLMTQGLLEQKEIDEYIEGLKEHYEAIVKVSGSSNQT